MAPVVPPVGFSAVGGVTTKVRFFAQNRSRKYRQKVTATALFQTTFHRVFNFSHKWLTVAFASKSGYTLAIANRIAHKGLHAETGSISDGSGIITLDTSCTFTNIPGPGVRTANFAAFGSWSEAHPKNAESLRNSDALMRVAVPRRRGPAGLRDLFLLLSELWLTHHVFSAFRVCETRGGITTLGVLCVLPKLPVPAC